MASNDDHFSNRAISAEIAENLKEFFPEFGDLSYDEFLEHQEGLYQSLNEFDRNKDTSVPTSDWSQLSGHMSESSRLGNSDSQIVLDEAFARSLLEEEFDELNISQPSRTETENRAGSSRETPVTEGLYQSLNEYDRNKDTSVPTSDWSQPSSHVGESSWHGNSDSQIALDEAFARSLLQEEFDELNISQPSRTEIENRAGNSRETPVTPVNQTATQGDIDPDNMTCEQPQSLGESVGSASSEPSQAHISELPSSKYRSGWFSFKKKESQECAICCVPFKDGDTLITLRCSHQYHSECIKNWSQLNKHCHICQKEVF